MEDKGCIFNIQKFSIHDGPGIRTVVFFKGCPLRCRWCANPESQKVSPEQMWDDQKKKEITVGERKTVDEIINEVMQDEAFYEESGGGVTLSGGEVLYQADFAIRLMQGLKQRNLHIACETTGVAKPEVFAAFIREVDLLYFDVKHYDSEKHREGVGTPNELILENLQTALAAPLELVVRIPVIPSYNNSLEDAKCFAALFRKLGVKQAELLPFHQFGEQKYPNLSRDYAMKGTPQLHSEDLTTYQEVLRVEGIDCQIR